MDLPNDRLRAGQNEFVYNSSELPEVPETLEAAVDRSDRRLPTD